MTGRHMNFRLDDEDDEAFDDEDFDEEEDGEDGDPDDDDEDPEEEGTWQVADGLTSQVEAPTLAPFSTCIASSAGAAFT